MSTEARTTDARALLGVYLNDHLAGATGGLALIRRLAAVEADWAPELGRLAGEIGEDREALLELMRRLDVPVRRYKTAFAWAAEKAGRLKPNLRLVTRSPLSRVVELELMRLGVEGKSAGWRTLRQVAETEPRLPDGRLDDLITRARRQADELEKLRIRAVTESLAR
jgi:hypothetical protein